MLVTLTKVFITDKSKDGQPLLTKKGIPYKKVGIKTREHGETWLSGFGWKPEDECLQWKEGQTVEIMVEQNGQYTNFKVPTKTDMLEERVRVLENQVKVLQGVVQGTVKQQATDYPTMPEKEEIDVDSIPF